MPNARAWGDSETEFARLLPQVSGPWLAISGGGADGAFGAGLLNGWSQTGNRPEFAVVTGVSIGSLIAPFAFLGSNYDEELQKSFTTISAAEIFEDRLTRDSLFDYWPLRRAIAERVTPKLLAEIAAEHKRGRRLLVATTSLDTGRRAVWNMGAIAERGDETALKLFRDILLASCSIPGFFSPVAIEVEANGKKLQEMHGDGTLTAPFFVVPETMIAPGGKSRPPFNQLYVLVNSKLVPDFKLPDRSIPEVLGRSIDVALTSALRAEIMLMNVGAGRHGVGLRIAHVDTGVQLPLARAVRRQVHARPVRLRSRAGQEELRVRRSAGEPLRCGAPPIRRSANRTPRSRAFRPAFRMPHRRSVRQDRRADSHADRSAVRPHLGGRCRVLRRGHAHGDLPATART